MAAPTPNESLLAHLRSGLRDFRLHWPKCFWTTLVLLLFVALLKLPVVVWVDRQLEQRTDTVYGLTPKQWIPRGFYENELQQNSVRSISAAFERGAQGVEVDFRYDPVRDLFLVAHDKPRIDAQGQRQFDLIDGRELTLEELMQKTAKGHYFWWDFKNLGELNSEETTRAIAQLEVIGAIHGVKERAYIEGSDPIRLARYKRAGFRTILALQPVNERWPGSTLVTDLAKLLVWIGPLDGIAIRYRETDLADLGPATLEALRHVPLFLFHAPPKRELVEKLVALPQVRVLLVGRGISVDLLDVEGLPPRQNGTYAGQRGRRHSDDRAEPSIQ